MRKERRKARGYYDQSHSISLRVYYYYYYHYIGPVRTQAHFRDQKTCLGDNFTDHETRIKTSFAPSVDKHTYKPHVLEQTVCNRISKATIVTLRMTVQG